MASGADEHDRVLLEVQGVTVRGIRYTARLTHRRLILIDAAGEAHSIDRSRIIDGARRTQETGDPAIGLSVRGTGGQIRRMSIAFPTPAGSFTRTGERDRLLAALGPFSSATPARTSPSAPSAPVAPRQQSPTGAPRYCRLCGTPLLTGAEFCHHCGGGSDRRTTAPPPRTPTRSGTPPGPASPSFSLRVPSFPTGSWSSSSKAFAGLMTVIAVVVALMVLPAGLPLAEDFLGGGGEPAASVTTLQAAAPPAPTAPPTPPPTPTPTPPPTPSPLQRELTACLESYTASFNHGDSNGVWNALSAGTRSNEHRDYINNTVYAFTEMGHSFHGFDVESVQDFKNDIELRVTLRLETASGRFAVPRDVDFVQEEGVWKLDEFLVPEA